MSNKIHITLGKIELKMLKVMPMILALVYLANSILSYHYIDVPILSYIGGVSIIPLIFMYLSSYTFRFCEYHRMFLHYIVVNDSINIYDNYVGIPVSNFKMLVLHLIIACIFLFAILVMYLKSRYD